MPLEETVSGQTDIEIARTLDLKGLLCPMPVVKMAQAIKQMEVGEVIEATATDPGVMVDIPAWCKSTGNEMLLIDKATDHFVFRVRRSQ